MKIVWEIDRGIARFCGKEFITVSSEAAARRRASVPASGFAAAVSSEQ
jgi:hypothetical protein